MKNSSVVGGRPKRRTMKFTIVAAAILLVATLAAAYWFFSSYLPDHKKHQDTVDRVVSTQSPGTNLSTGALAVSQAQQDAGDTTGALSTLDGSLTSKEATVDDKVVILVAKANIFMNTNRLDESADAYKQAIALQPANYVLHQGLGMTYVMQGKKDLARPEFETALSLAKDPNNPTPHGPADPVVDAQRYLTELDNA